MNGDALRRALLAGCGAAALLLAAILGLEVQGDAVPAGPAPRLGGRAVRPVAAVSVPKPRPPDQTEEWLADILARPLFTDTRRPAPPSAASATATPAEAALPRLAGILVSPGGSRAIFAAVGEGKPMVVAAGGTLAGFTVEAIGDGTVVLAGPDGKQTLRPSFDAHPPPPVDLTAGMQPPQGMGAGMAAGMGVGSGAPPSALPLPQGGATLDLRTLRGRNIPGVPNQPGMITTRFAPNPEDPGLAGDQPQAGEQQQ